VSKVLIISLSKKHFQIYYRNIGVLSVKVCGKFRKNDYDDDFSPKRNRRRDEKAEKRKIKHNYEDYDYGTGYEITKKKQ
jgi:hypothetical protein